MTKSKVRKIIILMSISISAIVFSKYVESKSDESCRIESVHTVHTSINDGDIVCYSTDELTLCCANCCSHSLEEGDCNPEKDGCCNEMYKKMDVDCSSAEFKEACEKGIERLECKSGTCLAQDVFDSYDSYTCSNNIMKKVLVHICTQDI